MANPQKAKGDAYERDLAKALNTHIFDGEERVQRAPLSGGGKVGLAAGGADLLGTPDLFVEAKRTERLNVREAMRQAEDNIVKTASSDMPVVMTRRSREPLLDSLCVVRLKDFLKLYRAYLIATGVKVE